MRRLITVIFIFLIFSMAWQPIYADCARDLGVLSRVSQVKKTVRSSLEFLKEKRGDAILVASLIASTAATTYISAQLPHDSSFLSQMSTQLLSTLSFLGSMAISAPLMEPISSTYRKLAFIVKQGRDKKKTGSKENARLEALWFNTQEIFSLNSQMSRNLINLFISSTRQNFYEARRSALAGNLDHAADQVAEAAIRMRVLFADVKPEDQSVKLAVRTALAMTYDDDAFLAMILTKIQTYDQEASTRDVATYYDSLLKIWFNKH